jgi:DNA-binding GntR family transcriptional regulator
MARTEIDFDDREYRYVQLAEIVRGRIEDGTYPPRRPIPSKRELTATYGVSARTVDTAMSLLKADGWIETVIGKGYYVVEAERRGHPHPRRRSTDK